MTRNGILSWMILNWYVTGKKKKECFLLLVPRMGGKFEREGGMVWVGLY